jgi:hypothetical protein
MDISMKPLDMAVKVDGKLHYGAYTVDDTMVSVAYRGKSKATQVKGSGAETVAAMSAPGIAAAGLQPIEDAIASGYFSLRCRKGTSVWRAVARVTHKLQSERRPDDPTQPAIGGVRMRIDEPERHSRQFTIIIALSRRNSGRDCWAGIA